MKAVKVSEACSDVLTALQQLPIIDPATTSAAKTLADLLPGMVLEIRQFVEKAGIVAFLAGVPICHKKLDEETFQVLDGHRNDVRIQKMLFPDELQNK